ncbi:MAG: fatty acid desaturase [Victivallales bacterium]
MAAAETASSNKNQNEQGSGREWPAWHATLSNYKDTSAIKSLWQLTDTLLPYFGLWLLMIMSIRRGYPYALTLVLAAIAAAFLVRIFILFHDCVHGSFFKKKGPNTFFGHLLGLMVFTPFDDWRFSHLRHHATYADLDARGFGDIWTMTLTEYKSASKVMRTCYRLYRSPAVMLGLGALFCFLLRHRLPARKSSRKERVSVIFTNLLIIGTVMIAAWSIGWRTYVLVQLPVIWMAGAAGVWLFYVQHQFDGVYWSRKKGWDAMRAAMEGSSFYKLPAVMRWFSGSIGYHHVHHLGPRIPNYRLKECYDAIPALQARTPLKFWKSLSAIRLKVWDEEQKKLVGFH